MLYQELINEFLDETVKIMGDELTGIYLHGSMAMNCFNPEKSDIDLLIIIENDINDERKMQFMKQVVRSNQKATTKGLELSIIKREYCNPFVYPTPFELHFSNTHLSWFRDKPEDYIKSMKGTDKDIAAHCTIINKFGVTLYGQDKDIVFAKVPPKYYADSIWSDIESAEDDIQKDPMYCILTLCRVLAFLKDDVSLSKQQGGEWGIENLPDRYRKLLVQAHECYNSDIVMRAGETANAFARDMLDLIRAEMKTF